MKFLSAYEAMTIADNQNRFENELLMIGQEIESAAKDGKYSVIVSIPNASHEIKDILKENGYAILINGDEDKWMIAWHDAKVKENPS